jgi:hypothetical protein
MMAVLLIVGIGFLLMGLLGIVFGIPVKEFSFGNTLILAGALAACTGTVLLGLCVVVRELKNIARRLGGDVATESRGETLLPTAASVGNKEAEGRAFLFSRDQSAAASEANAAAQSPLPWREEAGSRDRGRGDASSAPEPAEADSAVKPRRNLMFSSSSRKERERAEARAAEPAAADLRSPPAAFEADEVPPATFDDAWPQSERPRAVDEPPRRGGRAPSTFAEPPAAAQYENQPSPVTVLKSGVVDGMAYSLYSDGSIEAQMPEGMMRFASIDELRSHLDQRP